jgi:hypothetical protein
VPRRVKLPGADELFRSTGTDDPELTGQPATAAEPAAEAEAAASGSSAPPAASGGSGRVRHEEKITVYVSREELLALEQARLRLRGELGLAVDRGRMVRAAVALALAELETGGHSSELVRRLTAS